MTLRNNRFSAGWYHPNGIAELQIPDEWVFTDFSGTPNPIDPAPHSVFVPPEVRVLSPDLLPPAEWPIFVSPENTQVVKIFKGYGAWYSAFGQDFVLAAGNYAAIVEVFPDLVDHYDGNVKVWAADPLSARVRVLVNGQAVTDWVNMIAGSRVTLRLPFTITNGGSNIAFEFMLPFPLNNSGLFLSRLDVEGADPVPPECYGEPREDYPRTYNVIPQDATEERAVEIFLEGWRRSRETAGGSPDDAGIGNLSYKKARLYDIPEENHGAFLDFFSQYYPGTIVEFAGESTTERPDVIAYSQRDPAWSYLRLLPSTTTMGASGCLVTALAIYATLKDKAVTPGTLCICLRENGGFTSGGGLIFSAVSECLPYFQFKKYLLWDDTADMAIVTEALSRGPTILKVDWDVSDPDIDSHFVWAYDWTDAAHTDIKCVDPWTGEWTTIITAYPRGTIAQSVKGIVDFAIIDPEPPEEPQYQLRSNNCIGLHSGFVRAQSWNYIENSGTNLQKFFSAGDAYLAGLAAPGMVSIWRKYVGNDGITDPIDGHAQWLVDQLSAEVETVADALGVSQYDLLAKIHGAESLNEMYPTFVEYQLLRAVEFDCIFADKLFARFGNALAPVLGCAAVGNPHESEVHFLLPVARQAVKYNGFIGYHPYWAANETRSFLTQYGPYHAFRWMEWDKVFRDAGVFPRYALGECGICYAPDGINFNSGAGWKSCGSFEEYLNDDGIAEFNRRIMEWNALHGNRCAGGAIFCYGNWNWNDFELGDGEVILLNAWANGQSIARSMSDIAMAGNDRKAWINDLTKYLENAIYIPDDMRARLELELKGVRDV